MLIYYQEVNIMFEESPLKLYEQELKKQEEILNSLDKNLADLKVEKGKINPQEYERLYRQDEEKINQYMNKANSKITRLSKIIAAYYNVMDANEKLDNLEKIVPRDSQDQQELEIEKKYIEEIKNKNMAILPEEIKEVFLPKTVSDIKPQTNEKIKGIDDYRTEIEQNEKEIKHLKENIEELMALKDNIPTPEYERELETLKRYKNRENGKLLRNRQIVTAYELLENNQERITYLNSLVARDSQDKREIQEELNFLKTENERNKRFIPKTLHQSLMTMAKQDNRTNLENNPEILPVQDTGIIFQSEAESRSVNSQVMNSWTPEQPENKDILNQADAFITDDDIAQSNVPEVAVQSSNTNDQKSVSSLSLPDFLNNDQKTEENKTENKGKTLECNHLEMRNTIMSFLMHQYAN